MLQSSHRKRSKRLLKLLKELQEVDHAVTPPTLFAAKHLLQNHRRCTLITIRVDSVGASSPFESPRACLPNFIVSQLEGQKLTDPRNDHVLLSPIIVFVLLSLPTRSGSDSGYPTLFRWYCGLRRRTFYLFAYIKHDMSRRTYTLDELLALRGKPIASGILSVAGNPELGKQDPQGAEMLLPWTDSEVTAEIMRKPGSESSGGCKPTTARHKDDSSATSDELLFKGTLSRRLGRQLAREASRDPARGSNREPVRDSVIKDFAKDSARGPTADNQDPAHEASRPKQWKYRGRSDSDAAGAEPISAPGGVLAQQNEGFQRFYKAVVSPTHVRVTAGGRIVPNTRGQSSPTSKRTNDNPAVEDQNGAEEIAPGQPPLNPVGLVQPIPMMSQFMPGYHPSGFQPIPAPVSFVPFPFGPHLPPGFPFAQPAVNSPAVTPLAGANSLREPHNATSTDSRPEGHAANDRQEKIKMSPPEFFDCTKPYYFNGQFIYPVGPLPPTMGSPMVPVQMVGIPHGVTTPLSGHFMQPHPSRAGSAAASSPNAASVHGHAGIPPVANPAVIPANANFNTATPPPISSIKLSDITKKQIASFKGSLRYHEDQLQYNRHQIDEKEMEMKIQTLKGHIQRFEAILKAQLEYEETVLRKDGQAKDGQDTPQSSAVAEENKPSSQPAAHDESDELVRRRIALGRQGINTNIGEGGKAIFRGTSDLVCDPAQRPGLPNDAALAPVFQPRSYASTWGGKEYARELAAQEKAEKGHSMAAAGKLACLGVRPDHLRSMSQSLSTVCQPATSNAGDDFDTISNAGSSVNGKSAAARSNNSHTNFGVPYLLGTLPKGVNPHTARDQDYVYNRPLTEEERRARFLYWGKAPKSAVRGLPKFDGKHFYPPSPGKAPAAGSAHENGAGHGYRQTESDGDPFRPMTPVKNTNFKDVGAGEENCAALTRALSFETQINTGSEDFQMKGGMVHRDRENSVETSSIGSLERRSEKPGYAPVVANVIGAETVC